MVNTETVARRVTEALGDNSVKWLADETLIPYTTLTRRFKDGNFTVAELFQIASALKLSPSHFFASTAA